MAHYFVEPDLLGLSLSVLTWKNQPWYRPCNFTCDGCGRVFTLILVANQMLEQDQCESLLTEDLSRRGWQHSEHPRHHPARRDICPACVSHANAHGCDD